VTLDELNRLPDRAAAAAFERCCAAGAWVEAMVARRPFRDTAQLATAAEDAARALATKDWLEAFAGHPRIGERSLGDRHASTAAWAMQEQSGTAAAAETVTRALREGNQAYEDRFGYGFIVCATGKSAEEMLAVLERRLSNDPDHELRTAAEEQMKITRLRLEKLLAESA
jgi:2-oxo-4-hydroxy-4-carboxy-5-ureidoimidazoline decarboxylase